MRKLFNEEQLEYLNSIYKGKLYEESTRMMNEKFGTSFTPKQIKSYCHNHDMHAFKTHGYPRSKSNKCRSVPIGSISNLNGYKIIKVCEPPIGYTKKFDAWKYEHQIVWEEHYGPIPEGHVIVHLNGDKLDSRIENLGCVKKEVAVCFINHFGYGGDNDSQKTKLMLAELKMTQRDLKNKKSD